MSKGLCWECREKFHLETTGVDYKKLFMKECVEFDDTWLNKFSWVHCHHEPKEKPKCWCVRNSGPAKYCIIWNETVKVIFCPECGRML